jgi:5-methylcytosine-specific restriction endonuclease McrA
MRREADCKNMKQKFYSEHVYSVCDMLFSILKGVDGLEISDLIDSTKLVMPHRTCILHDLISASLDFYDGEWFFDFPTEQLDAYDVIVREAGLCFPSDPEQRIRSGEYSFEDKKQVYEVIRTASDRVVVPSTFHVLFADRNFIFALQQQLRDMVKDRGPALLGNRLDDQGRIKRVYIPAWLKKALFFRDRGECQKCGKDISGLRSPFDKLHLDHIVPLADYGNNDPTNFQLICSKCNQLKGTKIDYLRARFLPYWQQDG